MARIGDGDREHVNRLDCWCRPRVYLYCQYCEEYDDATQCFMCHGSRVFPMVASDRKRLQELVDDSHDRPPLIVVHLIPSADGLSIELHTHILMGQSGGNEDDDDDDEGDDTDEPAEWQKDPEAWKKNSG